METITVYEDAGKFNRAFIHVFTIVCAFPKRFINNCDDFKLKPSMTFIMSVSRSDCSLSYFLYIR